MTKFTLILSLLCAVPLWIVAQPTPASNGLAIAVEEFRIQTENLGVNADTPAGARKRPATRGWHGRLYENLRNDFLDAVPHEVVQRGGESGLLRRNQFGFNVSGPVLIPRIYDGGGSTFFSFSFEGMRESTGRSNLETIPTMAERTGDWSNVVDSAGETLLIFDPATTSLNPAFNPSQPVTLDNLQYNRQPFPGNRIPLSRLDPVAQRALTYYPSPNSDAGPFFENNYFVFSPEVNRADGFIASVDHSFLQRHRLDFQMNFSNGVDGAAARFPTIADPGQSPRDRTSRRFTLGHVFTASPTNINTVRLEVFITRTINQPNVDENGEVFPRYNIDPYVPMGRRNAVSRNVRNVFTLSDSFSTRWNAHRLSVNGEISHYQVNSFGPMYPSGSFEFSEGLTSLPGITNTGHAFASFLLGGASFAEQSLSVAPSYFRNWEIEVNMQDRWEVRPGLSLTLGANLSVQTPRTEKYDRQSTVSLTEINPANGLPGAMVVANENGYGRAFQPVLAKVEPTLGLAWDVFGRTSSVLRLNYARRYLIFPLSFGQFGSQAFNGTPAWISPNEQLKPAVVLADGLPNDQVFPDLRPEAANGTNAELIDTSGRQPTTQHFGISFQQEILSSLVVSVEGIHSHGRDMMLDEESANPNALPLSALAYRDLLNDEEFKSSLRPYPQYQDFQLGRAYPGGRFQRDSFELRVEKRSSAGLSVSASYEYSKEMNDFAGGSRGSRINFNADTRRGGAGGGAGGGGGGGAGGGGGGGGGGGFGGGGGGFGRQGVQDYYNLANEWALSSFNRPHMLTFNYMYELPIGPNKRFLNSTDWRRHFLEGWSISGVTSFSSGNPLSLSAEYNNTGGVVDFLRPNIVPGVDPHVPNPSPDLWFNPAAFVNPADFTVGNAPRTHPTLRNPSFQNHDAALNKRFVVAADQTLEFSASFFNFVNHANWTDPDTEIGTVESPNVNAGLITGSRGGRVVQLGLRLNF